MLHTAQAFKYDWQGAALAAGVFVGWSRRQAMLTVVCVARSWHARLTYYFRRGINGKGYCTPLPYRNASHSRVQLITVVAF
jgi:hypothetical protein